MSPVKCFSTIAIAFMVTVMASSASAAPIVITTTPQGDGHSLRARYGFFDTWNDYAFQSNANPVQAHHSYASGWGEIKNAYLQISLDTVPAGAEIASATLNLYITNVSGSGARLRHVSNSSNATGDASQQLAGNVDVLTITTSHGTGWLSIDVTQFIQSDLDNGHNWAAFSLPSSSYSNVSFYSAAQAGYEPHLSVTLIPEPASLTLFACGVTLIIARRRRPSTANH